MIRKFLFLALLAGAVSFPMLVSDRSDLTGQPVFDIDDALSNSETSPLNDLFNSWAKPASPTNSQFVPFSANNNGNAQVRLASTSQQLPITQPIIWPGPTTPPPRIYQPSSNLEEIFRFDVFPNWVKARWRRVSNTPGELSLNGLRVPLVTGEAAHDLTGSLTYYFDDRHQVQRIQFQGWTGDASYLVQFLSEKYRFKTNPTVQAGFYTRSSFGNIHSLLWIDDLPVVNQALPQRQMFVFLELNHPQGNLPLSTMANQAKAAVR